MANFEAAGLLLLLLAGRQAGERAGFPINLPYKISTVLCLLIEIVWYQILYCCSISTFCYIINNYAP